MTLQLNDPVRYRSGRGWAHGVVIGWSNDGRGNVTGVVIQTTKGQRVTRREGSVEKVEVPPVEVRYQSNYLDRVMRAAEGGTDKEPEDPSTLCGLPVVVSDRCFEPVEFTAHPIILGDIGSCSTPVPDHFTATITDVIGNPVLLSGPMQVHCNGKYIGNVDPGETVVRIPTWLRDGVIVSALRAWAAQPWQGIHGMVLADRLEEMELPAHAATARQMLGLDWRRNIGKKKGHRVRRRLLAKWRRVLKQEYGDFDADNLCVKVR